MAAQEAAAAGSQNRGILAQLSAASHDRHPHSNTDAALAPEETGRVPIVLRGVRLAFLRCIVTELTALERAYVDSGQFLNGVHTTSSLTDWQEFDRALDAYSGKACTLHTGLSIVETCMAAELTSDPETGAAYFGKCNQREREHGLIYARLLATLTRTSPPHRSGPIDTFVSYAWRGDGITLANLVGAIEESLAADPNVADPDDVCLFIDVFVCAQHRGLRPDSNTCPVSPRIHTHTPARPGPTNSAPILDPQPSNPHRNATPLPRTPHTHTLRYPCPSEPHRCEQVRGGDQSMQRFRAVRHAAHAA